MAEHSAERARFIEMRARVLTNVLLTSREDLVVEDLNGRDYGIDYLVTLRSEKPGLRQFAVKLRATHAPVTADTANRETEFKRIFKEPNIRRPDSCILKPFNPRGDQSQCRRS